ncbi:MAG: fibronectin type III domain-containing protein [Bacteroidetes bacterium]|nr:fibronectin type III domain-containing protein [Bacteroidota bacterium]MBU1720059.1 fibronectin type III domain-containing protein [Bacteroidota bacterium]
MKLIYTILIALTFAISQVSAQNAVNAYQAEEDGSLTSVQQSTYGLVMTDNYASRLYLLENGQLTKLYSSAGCGRYFTLSPGRTKIGFKIITPSGFQIPAIYNLSTRKVSELSAASALCGQVSFADNNTIVFTVGNNLHVLKNGVETEYDIHEYANIVALSPNASKVAYAGDDSQMKIFDFITQKITVITNDGKTHAYPQWSPDGNKLLFQSGEMMVYDVQTNIQYTLGPGLAPQWAPDSREIVFHRTMGNETELIASELFSIQFDGSQEIQITHTPDVHEMGASFVSADEIIFNTYNRREIKTAVLSKSRSILSETTIYTHSGNLTIDFFDVYAFHQFNNRSYSRLSPAPYVHQVYDTPDWHNGSGSCKPTSAVMALAFYNRVPQWPTLTDNGGTNHVNNYGSYVADKYRYSELFFNVYSDAYGTDSWGAYGYMWGTGTPTGSMQQYLETHGMISNTLWTSSLTFQHTKAEIDLGYPHVICSYVSSVGHVKLAIGYLHGYHTIVFNEPYGDKNTPGWPSNDGEGACYDWPGYNNGFVNLDWDGSHGTLAWANRAQSQQPAYNDTIIDDVAYNHGFYMKNEITALGGGHNIQQYYRDANSGYNGHFWWTITEATGSDICYVNWTPTIAEPGRYEVKVYIPATNATATTAKYKVYYAGGNTTITVNQSLYSNEWVSLGTYYFAAGQSGYVHCGDMTGIASQSVAFDAMKWSRVHSALTLSSTGVVCNGWANGTATASLAGSVGTVTYLWNTTPPQTTATAVNLIGGVYEVTVTDDNGTYIESVTVEEADQIATNPVVSTPNIAGGSDGTIDLNVIGGKPSLTYLWSPAVSTAETAAGLSAGVYYVSITDAMGCLYIDTVVLPDPICNAPTALTVTNITFVSATLNWTAASGAAQYSVRVKQDNWPIWDYYTTTSTSLTVNGLSRNSGYTWEVATVCNPGESNRISSTFTTSNTVSNITTTRCSGIFYDAGGHANNYGNNENYIYTIAPTGATQLTIDFEYFNVEPNASACTYDYLKIFDSNDTASAHLIGTYCSATGSPGTISATGGVLTFFFHSDNSTVKPGWKALWTSNGTGCARPETEIDTPAANWQTNDFSASFSDFDNNGLNFKERFFQVADFDGTNWTANRDNGFLKDDFGGTLDPAWVTGAGTWSVSGGTLRQTDEASSNTNIYIPVAQDHESVWLYQYRMKISGANSTRRTGLYVFSDDPTGVERNNSYLAWFKIGGDAVEIWENINDNDVLKTNDAFDFSNDVWYDVKILYNPDTVDGEFTIYIDDEKVATWTDHTPFSTGAYISLRTTYCSAEFDNFRVYKSRSITENVAVGAALTNDVRYQNANPTTPSCEVTSIVLDNTDQWSYSDSIRINVDWTNPTNIASINDGAASDEDTTFSASSLSANWTASTDSHSGIATYWYAIGTTAGTTNVVGWTNNGTNTAATESTLTLNHGTTYYFSVKAENGAGLWSDITISDGIIAQLLPQVAFTPTSATICAGESVTYTNNSMYATAYTWEFEGGNPPTSSLTDPQVTYPFAGVFDVKLVAIGIGGSDSVISTNAITVNANPVAGFTVSDTVLCFPDSVVFFTNQSTDATSWVWDFGTGNTSTDQHPYSYFGSLGSYTISLVAVNGLCDNDTLEMQNYIRIEDCTGFDFVGNQPEILVYPNPFVDELYLDLSGFENERILIRMMDIAGREIFTYSIDIHADSKFDLNHLLNQNLSAGMYILDVKGIDVRMRFALQKTKAVNE